MNPLSIGSATEVYSNASQCEIVRHWLDHAELAEVSSSVRTLVRSLGDEAEDEYWRETLGPIRKLAFAFCSVPVPFDQAALATGINWDKVRRQVRLCQHTFPDSHESLANIAEKLERLSAETSSPFIGPLEELISQSGNLSVMIRNPRMNQFAATYFAGNRNLRNARIISPAQLRGAHMCDVLATIGPCAWFPEYVFYAPRAIAIHVIAFRWIHDGWKPGPILLHNQDAAGGKNSNHSLGAMPRVGGGTNTPAPSDIQPADLLPPLPAFPCGAFTNTNSQLGSTEETLPVRLCHLSGNRAVFVAADDGATSLIIDTAETGRASVRRAPTDELEPGYYLLLRTSGGGDFIAPLADRILGDVAVKRRSQQAEWKDRLISKATEQFGPLNRRELSSRVASELRTRKLSEAKAANVHYWMSAKCISPRKPEDFLAILIFAGLDERAQELRDAMTEIDRAHKRAGFRIRWMLLQKIADMSLESLERDGEMVIDLGDQDGGALSAFQITGIQAEEFEVPVDRIGVLMDMEE
jgi:hypothetical protein